MPDEPFVITDYDREEGRVYIQMSEPAIVATPDDACDLALDIMDKGIREWPSPSPNVADVAIADWKRKFPPSACHTKTTSLYDQEEDQVYFAMSQPTLIADRDQALSIGIDLMQKAHSRREPELDLRVQIEPLDLLGPPELWPDPRFRKATTEELEAYKRAALKGGYYVNHRKRTPEELAASEREGQVDRRRIARLSKLIDRYVGIPNLFSRKLVVAQKSL